MKYVFPLLLVCSSFFSFSQITPTEMMKIYKMDMDQFETYSLNKGYEFSNTKDNENLFGVTYTKGLGTNTKYLTLYTRHFVDGIMVRYQTSNNNEFASFKNALKVNGFKLVDTHTFDGNIVKKYILKEWVIEIYSGVDDYVYFEINLFKP